MREAWVRLCGSYQNKGDIFASPEVRKVLNEIAHLYFALPIPKLQGANPLGEMLSSMFGGIPGGSQTRRMLSPSPASATLD